MKQIHTFPPLFNEKSEILILGSFPSVKSREQSFFYGHPQNRFWKVISSIFNEDLPSNIEEKKALILNNNLALFDVIKECEITGSSDSSIKNVVPNDINSIIEKSNIKKIFTNGKTAYNLYEKYIENDTKIKAICLPSTSPANAIYNYDKLKNEWKLILQP